jgi:ketopantoate reductase
LNIVKITGAGAVGSVLASRLAVSGVACNLISRTGEIVSWVDVARPDSGAERVILAKKGPSSGPELHFFTTKARDLEAAAVEAAAVARPGSVLVSLCNGWHVPLWSRLARRWPDLYWRIGTTAMAVSRRKVTLAGRIRAASGIEAHDVLQINSADTVCTWGPLPHGSQAQEDITPLESRLCQQASFCRFREDSAEMHLEKWIFNVVINSIAAVERRPRNGLVKDSFLLRPAFSEAFQLACELGTLPEGTTKERLWDKLLGLIDATSGNENSMVADIRDGRMTESPWLAGLAVGRPEEFPTLKLLHSVLAMQELKRH